MMQSETRSSSDVRAEHWGPPLNLMVVLLFVLFFQGCDRQGLSLTMGPLVPFVQVDYDEETLLDSQLVYVSVGRFAINVAALVMLFVVAPRVAPRWSRLIRSRRFQTAAVISAMLFNLVLFAEGIWADLVFAPIILACDRIIDMCAVADSWRQVVVAAVSRGYFVCCWVVFYATMSLALFLGEQYLGFDRRRWWQFNLRLLLAIIFVVCTVLGILLRLSHEG